MHWLNDLEWNRPDRRSFEIARAAVEIVRIQVRKEDKSKVRIEDFLVRYDPNKRTEDTGPKELPPLKLMDLPSDHPIVVQAKMRWNTIIRPPHKRPSPKDR